eukprot:g45816.t1
MGREARPVFRQPVAFRQCSLRSGPAAGNTDSSHAVVLSQAGPYHYRFFSLGLLAVVSRQTSLKWSGRDGPRGPTGLPPASRISSVQSPVRAGRRHNTSSKWELNEGDSPPNKKGGGKKKKTEGLEGWTEPELYEHWIGMYGVLPPASLQYDGEGKLLADAQTYPEEEMIQKKKEQKALGRKKPRFDPLEAHTFEQDETMEDHIAFIIRRGLVNPFEFSEDGGAASKVRLILPYMVPWGNSRFGNFLSTCAYDVSNTATRLEGKLTAEALLKKCKIPKSFFVSHFPSVHGKLEKVKTDAGRVLKGKIPPELAKELEGHFLREQDTHFKYANTRRFVSRSLPVKVVFRKT